VACGDEITLNKVIEYLQEITGNKLNPIYNDERIGDVKHSKASIKKIHEFLNYEPNVSFFEGLKIVYKWYLNQECK
jgi:UDP-N-acetylglucosamine 4-epimerase